MAQNLYDIDKDEVIPLINEEGEVVVETHIGIDANTNVDSMVSKKVNEQPEENESEEQGGEDDNETRDDEDEELGEDDESYTIDEVYLTSRANTSTSNSITYCLIPNSLEMSGWIRYGIPLKYRHYVTYKKLLET